MAICPVGGPGVGVGAAVEPGVGVSVGAGVAVGAGVDVGVGVGITSGARGGVGETVGPGVGSDRRWVLGPQLAIVWALASASELARARVSMVWASAQGFTGIVLQMEAAEQSLETSPDALPDHLDRARALAREGLQEARRSVWGLMPHALEQATLDVALEREVQRFEAEGQAKIAFKRAGKSRELPPDGQTVLLRICQESLTNIRRHADASQVSVELEYLPREVQLRVKDDGSGFDPIKVSREKSGVSFGLIGMRQRAEQLSGELIIDSAKNKGTSVRLTLPTP